MQRQIESFALGIVGDAVARRRRRRRWSASRWAACPGPRRAARGAALRAAGGAGSRRADDRRASLASWWRRPRARSAARRAAAAARRRRVAAGNAGELARARRPQAAGGRCATRLRRVAVVLEQQGRQVDAEAVEARGSADAAPAGRGADASPRRRRARSSIDASRRSAGRRRQRRRARRGSRRPRPQSSVTTSPPNMVLTCLPLPKLCTARGGACADRPAVDLGAERVGGVFDDGDAVRQRRADLGHRRGHALDVRRNHGAGPRPERGGERLAGHHQAARTDVGDADAIAERAQKAGDAGGGVGGDDDLVAGPAAGMRQHRRHPGARGADRDRVAGAEQRAAARLEFLETAAAALEERGERRAPSPRAAAVGRRRGAGERRPSAGASAKTQRARRDVRPPR